MRSSTDESFYELFLLDHKFNVYFFFNFFSPYEPCYSYVQERRTNVFTHYTYNIISKAKKNVI